MVEMTPPPMWLQPVGTATRDVTGENNRYLLSSIASTWFRNCIKGAGIGCIDWPAATQGGPTLLSDHRQLPGTEIQWRQFGLEFEGSTEYSVPIPAIQGRVGSTAGI
jgi:hypothetical protein